MTAIVTLMFLLSGLVRSPRSCSHDAFRCLTRLSISIQYLALDVRYLMIIYLEHGGTSNGPANFLNQPVNDPVRNVHPVIFALMTFLGDGFMVNNPANSALLSSALICSMLNF